MKQIVFLSAIINLVLMTISVQSQEFTVVLDPYMHEVADVIPTSSGNFLIAARDNSYSFITLTSVSEDGEILWTRYYTGDMYLNAGMVQKQNGNILVPMGRSYAFLLEIDQSGDSVRSVSIAETTRSYFLKAIELPDLNLMAVHLIYNNDPYFPCISKSRYVKLSPEMDIIESYPTQSIEIRDVMLCSDTTFMSLVEHEGYVYGKITEHDFNTEQTGWLGCETLNPDLYKLVKLNDNNIVAAFGATSVTSPDQAALVEVNGVEEMIFCNDYPINNFEGLAVDENSENMYALGFDNGQDNISRISYSGELETSRSLDDTLSVNHILFNDDYLYITAKFGYYMFPKACFIKMHKNWVLSVEEHQEMPLLNVYPNPATSYVCFEHSGCSGRQEMFVEVFNTKGILIESIFFYPSETLKVWDSHGISPGIYFYRFKSGGAVLKRGKIVLQ